MGGSAHCSPVILQRILKLMKAPPWKALNFPLHSCSFCSVLCFLKAGLPLLFFFLFFPERSLVSEEAEVIDAEVTPLWTRMDKLIYKVPCYI